MLKCLFLSFISHIYYSIKRENLFQRDILSEFYARSVGGGVGGGQLAIFTNICITLFIYYWIISTLHIGILTIYEGKH